MPRVVSGLLDWVGNILFFLVFMTVAEHLLPGKTYHKYVRLAAGMVLILLVLQPVTGGFHLEGQISRWFESFSFQQDAKELSREILGIEERRLGQVMDSYEQAVEADVNGMATEMGLMPVQARAVIERDRESGNYGRVVRIEMEVGCETGEGEGGDGAVQVVNPVRAVNPVDVRVGEAEKKGGETQTGEGEAGEKGGEAQTDGEVEPSAREGMLEELRRKVEGYYGLEAGDVEIKLQRRQG